MSLDVHNILFERLTSLAMYSGKEKIDASEFGLIELTEDTICSYCHRFVSDQPEHLGMLGFQGKDSYKNEIVLCGCCNAFFANNPAIMGIEKLKAPNTGQKFGMLKGTGALIDIKNHRSFLFTPPKSFDKFPDDTKKIASDVFGIEIVKSAGISAQISFISKVEGLEESIWISDFGRKTDSLIANLVISDSLKKMREVNDDSINSSSVALKVTDFENLIKIAKILNSSKAKKAYCKLIVDFSNGRISPAEMSKAISDEKFESLSGILPLLPPDPHLRKGIIMKAATLDIKGN
ncbi:MULTISPECIES: hypothetical protein [Vibrio]|uniref:hypothetical protein n=1 Tax=Vibrio TaxID=662 RepID=UPI0005F0F85E|nr:MULTISPECIES: hypothetical protein [Vibrio]MCX8795834.1 hypothetical protein [Vibrio parahaemolyticus]HDY7671224.1 hypothetical protein [Vibrio vulnificus]